MKLKIDKDISDLFGDMSVWEYDKLKSDIEQHGIKVPLVVSTDDILVCGHQRYRVSQELSIPDSDIPIIRQEFATKMEMINYAIDDNLMRRNQNTFQKGYTGLKWLKFYEAEGRKRMSDAGKATKEDFGKEGLLETIKLDSTKLISTELV